MIRRLGATLVALAMTASLVVALRAPARAAALCATPGRDGSPGALTGIVNTYWPGTANAAAGATSITVGAHATGDASTAVASGDLLLVVQMQGATINTTNTSSYGDGSGSGTGAISTTAGSFEYV
ncbi:MAG: isopeptide-forming domain-containing fimbrial protein, partial [Candidatus Eremiobacteraeota bacterium]|nr:isopeptide-forming domain-containing fimbrial protein [Candidatus Eremiobacteraeota bacterium]